MKVQEYTKADHARSLYFDGRHNEAFIEAEVLCLSPEPLEKLSGLLLKACIQSERNEFSACLVTLKIAGPLIDDAPAKSQAAFYGQRAFVRVKIGKRSDALVDYEAARVRALEAEDELSELSVRNNLARIYGQTDRFDEAISESDKAIQIARKLNERIYLGRCYDQRALILNDNKLYVEAVRWSEKAIAILGSHPAAAEARMTHGRALIGVGESYLDHPDPVENFRVRREIVNSIIVSLNREVIEEALERCEGNIKRASQLLNVQHQSLQGSINRFDLRPHQKRQVKRSIIVK